MRRGALVTAVHDAREDGQAIPAHYREEEGAVQGEVHRFPGHGGAPRRQHHRIGGPGAALLVDHHPDGVLGLGDEYPRHAPGQGAEIGLLPVENVQDPQGFQPLAQLQVRGYVEARDGETDVQGLLLLDTPGILWPKFEDPEVGVRLAYTGAVKDDILDLETLSARLLSLLWRDYPEAVRTRFKIEAEPDTPGAELLEQAGRKRGFLLPGGVIDTERTAKVVLEEYRSCKLGRFTLERPEDLQ